MNNKTVIYLSMSFKVLCTPWAYNSVVYVVDFNLRFVLFVAIKMLMANWAICKKCS
jgi:hypothetical protein